MSHTFPNLAHKGEEPRFKKPLSEIAREVPAGGALEVLSAAEYITNQQVRWWKGVLLPALAKDTGDSIGYWETILKTNVLPDEFQPYYVPINRQVFPVIPSITKLSKTKMNDLIEGSVDFLRGKGFAWVMLPDSELRKEK